MATSPLASAESQPWLHQHGQEIQAFGTARLFPIGLSLETRLSSCQRLNRILADTQILDALYKKHHWQVRGATFYQLHLLLDKHAGVQLTLIDTIAERVQTLGGLAVGDPRHVAEITAVPRPPDGAEEVPAMLSRLLEVHVGARGATGPRGARRRLRLTQPRVRSHDGTALLDPRPPPVGVRGAWPCWLCERAG
jgi:starvation-inducible DNA-binding protein